MALAVARDIAPDGELVDAHPSLDQPAEGATIDDLVNAFVAVSRSEVTTRVALPNEDATATRDGTSIQDGRSYEVVIALEDARTSRDGTAHGIVTAHEVAMVAEAVMANAVAQGIIAQGIIAVVIEWAAANGDNPRVRRVLGPKSRSV